MVQVIFTHDDECKKWEVQVTGTTDKVEARQAFTAVVLTCQMADPKLLEYARVSDDFKVSVAFRK